MKKTLIYAMAAAVALSVGVAGCNEKEEPNVVIKNHDIKVTTANLSNWLSYADRVAHLLARDAENLLKSWETKYDPVGESYASYFKSHRTAPYTSAASCVEQIIDGCVDIANEVGEAKIGDPYNLLAAGRSDEALYAVESWYSWHSREDYGNNIRSILNSYYGSLDGETVSTASMSALVGRLNPELDKKVKGRIALAYNAILNIPAPFRNNIGSAQTVAAMQACANLEHTLDNELKPFIINLNGHDAELNAIVDNYVDNVVLPTYTDLKERAAILLTDVLALVADPSDANFQTACRAWLSAREPWERSEAFLFGPVDALGLDPNMDSWPLDVEAIVNHIKSGNFSDLEWDDESEAESAQNVRGFHTLEFLLFSNGQPRTVEAE